MNPYLGTYLSNAYIIPGHINDKPVWVMVLVSYNRDEYGNMQPNTTTIVVLGERLKNRT